MYTPPDDMNVRAAFSQTVSRPDFRELTPVTSPPCPASACCSGNPNLVTANITNYDLRWEWFFTPLELASAGFFYKDSPIRSSSSRVERRRSHPTSTSTRSATLWGFEFEVRKNFDSPCLAAEVWWLRTGGAGPGRPPVRSERQRSNRVNYNQRVHADTPVHPKVSPPRRARPLLGQPPFASMRPSSTPTPPGGPFGCSTAPSGRDRRRAPIQPDDHRCPTSTERRDQLDFVWLID